MCLRYFNFHLRHPSFEACYFHVYANVFTCLLRCNCMQLAHANVFKCAVSSLPIPYSIPRCFYRSNGSSAMHCTVKMAF